MRRRFSLLVKKNLIVELKFSIIIILEILIISAIFMMIIATGEVKSQDKPNETTFHKEIILNDLTHFKKLMEFTTDTIPYQLYYTPNDENTKKIVETCVEDLKLSGSRGFKNESELVKNFNSKNVLAGLVFEAKDLILRFPCVLRTNRNKKLYKMSDYWLTRCSGVIDSYDRKHLEHVDFYAREGFLQLLYCTFKAKNGGSLNKVPNMISIYQTQDPDVGCMNNIKRRAMSSESFFTWFLYSFIFLIPFLNLLWKLAREHEENIFAHNVIYGFSYTNQRLAHFVVALLHFLLLDLVVLLFLIYMWSPMTIQKIMYMFCFLIIYNMLLIVYAMILATLLANGKTALWCGATLWLIAYVVFSEVLINLSIGLNWKALIKFSLFFNNMMPSYLVHLRNYDNLNIYAMAEFFGLLWLILLLYLGILHGADYLFPGLYKKCYFYQDPKSKGRKKRNVIFLNELNRPTYQEKYEYGPLNGKILEFENVYTLCKDPYEKDNHVIGVSMTFFKNEISVITGAVGSGKAAVITSIAGWQYYHGHIRFYKDNEEVLINWTDYRQYIDILMPNNHLYDELTVKETLKYFIELKYPQQEDQDQFEMALELNKWLDTLKPIINNPHKRVRNLSFGEKRLLSLCCTLSCNTIVVLLNEPTLHMKADHQYKFWDILKREKQDRCIILTTISIDEANEIGDRIGILHKGHLIGWGTSFYLRTTFDVGLYLICFLTPLKAIKPITALLEKYIADVKVHQHFIDRVVYILPSNKKGLYQRILIDLEKDSIKLGITNFYVSGCHLNDVYMRLTSEPLTKSNTLRDLKNTLTFLDENEPTQKDIPKKAMFYKKLYLQAKNSLPVWAIFISCFLIFAFNRMTIESLNKDRILFASEMQTMPKAQRMEIVKVRDLKGGQFVYENVKSDDNSYEKRKEWPPNSMSAIEEGAENITLWFNEKIFHSAPLAMHLAFKHMGIEGNFVHKPIKVKTNRDKHITLGIITPLTMSMVFVALNEERFSNMMTLQRIAGLTDTQYWLSTFIWDYVVYLLICLLYLILIIADAFTFEKMFAAYFLFICGMLSLILIYLMTLFIHETGRLRAYFKIFFIQLSIGILPYVLYINIMQNYTERFFYFLLLSPGFAILHGTSKIFNNDEKIHFSTYFRWNYPGFMDSACFLTSIAFILLIIFIVIFIGRKRHLQSTPKKVRNFASVCYPYDDQRVVKEKVRISNMNIRACRAQSVLVDQLENILPKTGNRVKAISFALNTYTCFGIYGSFASGKTHLLKQLIGEEGFWFGEVYMAGFSCKQQMTQAAKHLGYCPQDRGFNALLTPRELFAHFLLITGVIEPERLDILLELSITLKLRSYMNTRMEFLPYNIQRRVNLGIALIADNQILIFDEPTKGLAAFDRQLIWSIIKHCRSLGKTIIFTSTDTLDIRELADEIIVVNDGEMLAYDNPHAIEFQYNVGFCLEIKVYNDGVTLEEVEENLRSDIENLNRFIMVFHGESEILYCSGNVVKYYVPVENITYSYLFGTMEKNRSRLNITEYTITPILLTNALRILQMSRKEKKRHVRTRPSVLNPKVLPRRD